VRNFLLIPLLLLTVALLAPMADAAVGLTEIAGKDGDGVVTVYYPSASEPQALKRGPFTLRLAWQGAPQRGNGRLIVISHGSGGSPSVHADLARALVEQGFVVAMPEHRGDNYKDPSKPGPESWQRRPAEVSRAIDVVGQDPRFAPLLALDRVGMYGMSAGGHTALSLAGGRWSPARFKEHCDAHIAEDFPACVGLATRLSGGLLDGFKKTIALWVIRYRFSDATWRTHTDPRIAAVVAGVPYAADFDMPSLAAPPVPVGLVTARKDKWLSPRFHGDRVLQACAACDRLADFANGGHGALLSPLPPKLSGLVGDLLNDPPGFDRAELPAADQKIAAFFRKHLRPSVTSVTPPSRRSLQSQATLDAVKLDAAKMSRPFDLVSRR
jgi:predicted dienelactone hydrolase